MSRSAISLLCATLLLGWSGLASAATTSVWGWGADSLGQLGDGTTTDQLTPVPVYGLGGVEAIAAGYSHSLALLPDGTVRAWGENFNGALGDGTTDQRHTPVAVYGLSGVVAIAAGGGHSLALLTDGTVHAWGRNGSAALGDGTTTDRLTPVPVYGLSGVGAIAAGFDHSLALLSDGTVRAWGNNEYGQLGDGTTTNRLTPVLVYGLSGVVAIVAGGNHNLALLSDGTVRAWGANEDGQLGDGSLSGVEAIAAGYSHSLALLPDGTVRAWGDNTFGALGDGTTTDRLTPVPVSSLSGVGAIAGGAGYSLALLSDGTVRAWGANGNGQLGDGTTTNRLTPVLVYGLSGVVAIAAKNQYSLAIVASAVIAGTVTATGVGLSGVTLNGLPGSPTTDASGSYTTVVPVGWSGTVTPTKSGYTFSPASRTYTNVSDNQMSESYTASLMPYTIAGTVTFNGVGLSGVTLNGLPGSPTTDASGSYTTVVPAGWSGTVTPMKIGYALSPASRTYTNVSDNQMSESYTASVSSYIIEGSVQGSVAGLMGSLTLIDLPGVSFTNSPFDITYVATVPTGWSGTVTPTKSGYTFSPASRTYTNVRSNLWNQDYVASLMPYTIAGTVTFNGVGLSGVTLNGLPGSPTTDASGSYTTVVPFGWSGTVTPMPIGYTFSPASRTYTTVSGNLTSETYTASVNPYTITGTVTSDGVGLSGVTLNGLPGSPTTDASGSYTAPVPAGWSGTVTPEKSGYTFSPTSRTYTTVRGDQTGRDFTAGLTCIIAGIVTPSDWYLSGVTLNGLPGSPTTDWLGRYGAPVPAGWSGTVTPTKAGYTFSPASRTYSNVRGDTTHEIYAASVSSYTLADLAGTWTYVRWADQRAPGSPAAHWTRATLTLDASGGVLGGTVQQNSGDLTTLTGGTATITRDGGVSVTATAASGHLLLFRQGRMEVGKGLVVGVDTSAGDEAGLAIAIKGGGSFAPADLAGTWAGFLLEDTPAASPENDPVWVRLALTVDDTGAVSSWTREEMGGATESGTGSGGLSLALDSTGAIVWGMPHWSAPAHLDPGKGLFSAVYTTEASKDGLGVFLRSSPSYAPADLAGAWSFFRVEDHLWPSPNDPGWTRATFMVDSAGTVTGGSLQRSAGPPAMITIGAMTLTGSGAVTATVMTPTGELVLFTAGQMDAGKAVISGVGTSATGAAGLGMALKHAEMLVPHPGDFNGDGKADLLWQHQTTGTVILWYLDGPALLDWKYLYPGGLPEWKVVGSGDFNGDGKADLLWQNQTTGAVIIWYMDGSTMLDAKYLYGGGLPDWKVVGSGDFNGDGKVDLLWQNQTTGRVIIWYMDGATILGSPYLEPDSSPEWKVVGAGDIDGDGRASILWQHQITGAVTVWNLRNTTTQAAVMLDSVPLYAGGLPEWKVVGAGDVDGDGKADILWQHQTTGAVIVWTMDGSTMLDAVYLYRGGLPEWKAVGPK